MITSTNPVVANALGINSGVALNGRQIGESREWNEASRKWGRATYALSDLEKHLRHKNKTYAAQELAQKIGSMSTCITHLGAMSYD